MPTLSDSPAWKALAQHQREMAHLHMRELFAQDPERLLPAKILCGNKRSSASPLRPAVANSRRASASVFPFINASVWAKKFDRRMA
jgi:hypothetical protein